MTLERQIVVTQYGSGRTEDVSISSVSLEGRQRVLWMGIRQGLLGVVDAIEVFLNITPRTSELRKLAKR